MEDPLAFMARMKAILSQVKSKYVQPEGNCVLMRKAGNLTEADLIRLINFTEAAHDFIENNKGQPTL